MALFPISRKGYDKTEVESYIKKLKADCEQQLKEQKDRIFELKNQLSGAEARLELYRGKEELIAKSLMSAQQKADEIERVAREKHDMEVDHLRAFHSKWQRYYDEIIRRYPIDDDLIALRELNRKMTQAIEKEDSLDIRIFEAAKPAPAPAAKEPARAEDIHKEESERISKGGVNLEAISKVMDDSDPGDRLEKAFRKMNGGKDNAFEPLERIKDYLGKTSAQPKGGETAQNVPAPAPVPAPKTKKNILGSSTAVLSNPVSDTGFSYEEALNPTESIEEIMKGLGLMDDDR